MNKIDELTNKWAWMMDYCKKKLINPAEKWAWEEAAKAYELKNGKEDKND